MVTLDLVARLIPGLLLLLAGVSKGLHFRWFAGRVDDYGFLPYAVALPVACVIVVVEATLGVLLVTGVATQWSAIGAACLLLVFTLGMVVTLLRGRRDLQCGCFKSGGVKVSWRSVARNLSVMTLLLLPLRWSSWSSETSVLAFTVSLAVIALTICVDVGLLRKVRMGSSASSGHVRKGELAVHDGPGVQASDAAAVRG